MSQRGQMSSRAFVDFGIAFNGLLLLIERVFPPASIVADPVPSEALFYTPYSSRGNFS